MRCAPFLCLACHNHAFEHCEIAVIDQAMLWSGIEAFIRACSSRKDLYSRPAAASRKAISFAHCIDSIALLKFVRWH
jgi:hypothetical protein